MIDAAQFDAVSFDVYGTILNWEPEIAAFLTRWSLAGGKTLSASDLLKAYDQARQPIQNERPIFPYPEVLRRTLLTLGETLGIGVSPADLEAFSGLAATHQPFKDSAPALRALRQQGLKLAALSNIDDRSFAQATRSAGIDFDVVVTAQRVGAYKPDSAHFWAALADLQALGIPMNRVLHVAQSRRADIVVANQIGLSCVWVNRTDHTFGRAGMGAEDAIPDLEVDSLRAVAEVLGAIPPPGVR